MTQIQDSRKAITFWYCAGSVTPIRALRYLTPRNVVSVWSDDRIVQFASVDHAGKVYLVRRIMSESGLWGAWETYRAYPPHYTL